MNATFSEVTALMDHLVCEGIQRLVLESTSDYWRIWYYLAEAAGLEVWLVNARDVKRLPGDTPGSPAPRSPRAGTASCGTAPR